MTPDKGVFKRKGSDVWQHRIYVPRDLRDAYGGKDALPAKSLGTRDLAEANRRARGRLADKEQEFAALRASKIAPASTQASAQRPLLNETIERWASDQHRKIVDQDFKVRADCLGNAKKDPDAFWAGKIIDRPQDGTTHNGVPYSYWDELRNDPEIPLETGVAYALHRHREARLHTARTALRLGDVSAVEQQADLFLKGYAFDSSQRLTVCRRLLEAEVAALGAIVTAEAPHFPSLHIEPANDDEDPLLSVAMEGWLGEKQAIELTERRIEDCEAAAQLLLEIVGNKPLSQYSKGDVRRYKEVLKDLPANRSKLPATRKLGAVAAAREAKRLGIEALGVKTVNTKYLGNLHNLFEYAIGHYDKVNRNPFANAALPVRDSPRKQWDPFETEALATFFNAPLYTGCKSATKWLEPGPVVPRDSVKFWLPLVLLYTGCRVNEACKLRVASIACDDGIYFFNIEWEADDEEAGIAGRVKNTSSERRVPIHQDLISFGFLEFVARAKSKGSERLFPELKPNRYGKLYSTISQRFSDTFLPGLALKTDKTSLKSFRHNFVDAARNSRIPDPIIQALKGDTFEGTLARYGHGKTDLEMLDEEMKKLHFKGLDLSHLKLAPHKAEPQTGLADA